MAAKQRSYGPLCLCFLTACLLTAASAFPAPHRIQDAGKPPEVQDEIRASPPVEFQNALKAAEANLASGKGQAYEKKMRESTRGWLASEVARCAKERGGTAFGPFTVLVRVGKSGKAEQVQAWPETYIADCLRPKFAAADYPKPPKPSWWFKMDIRIEFKDSEAGGEPPAEAKANAGIPYSGELGVMVAPPAGWVLDNKSGVSQGTHAVMYPQGSSWRSAPEVMYVNVDEFASGETFEQFVAADVNRFKKEFLGIKIEELDPIVLRSGGKALVRRYSGGAYPSFECVAYAHYGTGAATYVLTCRTQAGLERTVGLFRDMVARSYPVKMKFDGKPPLVTLNEPGVPAKSAEDVAKAESGGQKDSRAEQPLWRQGGYSYWSRFKPGSFVTFRYILKSAASDQDMLKTITLKNVTPDSVVLEFQESPRVTAKKSPSESRTNIYQRSRFEFRAVDEDFQEKDLFGGQLSLSPAYILDHSDREKAGEGVEDIDWKGVKLPTTWKKFQFGGPASRTTVSIWLCDEVPRTVARMVRELEDQAAFRQEFNIEDFKSIGAEPADIERLRAARKPSPVEVPASSYLASRFRFTESMTAAFSELLDALSSLRSSSNVDWVDMMTKCSPFPAKFREIQSQLGEDEQKAAQELGREQMAKLQPLLGQAGRLVGLHVRLAETIVDYLTKTAVGPPDPALAASTMEETGKIMSEISAGREKYLGEFRKAGDLTLKFIRTPGGNLCSG